MAWVRIDDQAPRNAKLLKAGPAAAWMWVCGIAHCQSHLSEGFIAEIAIPMIGVKGHERSHKLAAALVTCGLFERVDGGYMVHDYLDFNETKEQAIARKTSSHAAKVAAGRAGGIASGVSRSNEAKGKQVLEAKRSPDPTRPDRTKNPLTPFQGARVTRADKKLAKEIRRNRFGRCHHEPPCEDGLACEAVIASELAAKRAS